MMAPDDYHRDRQDPDRDAGEDVPPAERPDIYDRLSDRGNRIAYERQEIHRGPWGRTEWTPNGEFDNVAWLRAEEERLGELVNQYADTVSR